MTGAFPKSTDWDWYRYFLAVAEAGSLSAAAQNLGVTHPTIRRQILQLESSLGTKLFNRMIDGYSLNAAGRQLLALVHEMNTAALEIEKRTAAQQKLGTGPVSVSASMGLGTCWLASLLPDFRNTDADIKIELVIATDKVDLMRQEADIALRIGEPGSQDLFGRRVGSVKYGLYAATLYLDQFEELRSAADLKGHLFIESSGEIEHHHQAQQLRKIAGDAEAALRCNNILTQFAAMRAGFGIMAAPSFMTDGIGDIRQILTEEFQLELDLWLLVHPELVRVPRIRKVVDFILRQVSSDHHFRILGESHRDTNSEDSGHRLIKPGCPNNQIEGE